MHKKQQLGGSQMKPSCGHRASQPSHRRSTTKTEKRTTGRTALAVNTAERVNGVRSCPHWDPVARMPRRPADVKLALSRCCQVGTHFQAPSACDACAPARPSCRSCPADPCGSAVASQPKWIFGCSQQTAGPSCGRYASATTTDPCQELCPRHRLRTASQGCRMRCSSWASQSNHPTWGPAQPARPPSPAAVAHPSQGASAPPAPAAAPPASSDPLPARACCLA
mmetsp:Transcript_37287/g.97714  ORF Transcript_37287/g.97714 Transcript_37287/m.97714 type:complete len:224 (+) Transcript_37287:100-771(+)